MPRDHQKSAVAGYYVAWRISRNPAIRVLYISSTSNLATKQLKFIKDILTSDIYRRYWPEMVNIDEGKREKWTESEISVDHPKRKYENVRDPTVFTAGLTTSITGLHCDLQVLDDVVTFENAYTEDGRSKTLLQYSLLASIAGTNSTQLVVGTRYHPKDLYETMLNKELEVYDEEGNVIEHEKLYEIFQRAVEDLGDGTGNFLWPRQRRPDGEWFGFNREVLAKKRALYSDPLQFRAQYYNDPNDPADASIGRECFQYYERGYLTSPDGVNWFIKGNRLNIFASIDFAYSLSKKSDYTAITVVGVDQYNDYYVLDIARFKTDLVSVYFDNIIKLHKRWGFRKMRAEVTAAQATIVKTLKNDYIKKHNLSLTVEDYKPTRNEGNKEERIEAVLQPKYHNRQVWHTQDGLCQILEEELILRKPPHDDIKDALASCIDFCIAPSGVRSFREQQLIEPHRRFGGYA